MYSDFGLLIDIVTGVEFWICFIISNVINELLKDNTMKITNILIMGICAVVWSLDQITCKNISTKSTI